MIARLVLLAAFLVQSLSVALSDQAGRALDLADVFKMTRISNPVLSPDGKWIAYIVTTPNLQENRNESNLWVVSSSGGTPRRLTVMEVVDRTPAWSPDSKQLAFEGKSGDQTQIWLVNVDGNDPCQFTTLSTQASRPVWSPDGATIAFVSCVFPEYSSRPFAESDALNRALLDEKKKSTVKARVITRLLYRHWDSWVEGKREHIFVQRLDGGQPKDVTPGDRDAIPTSSTFSAGVDYAFSPDGRELAYTATPSPAHEEAWNTNHDICLVSIQGGNPKQLTTNPAADGYPRYSPDGKYIAYRAQSVPAFEADRWQIVLYERATGKRRSLTESFDASVKSFVWSPDSREIYFTCEEKGNMPIFCVSIRGNDVRKVFDRAVNQNVSVSPDGKRLFFTHMSAVRPIELYGVGTDGMNLTAVTRANDALFSELHIPEPESVWYDGNDSTKIHAWLFKPPRMVPGLRYPLIYLVHGGPQNAWLNSWHYRWNPALWAAQGYVVMAPNPRGSTGFGQKFVNEISSDWGGRVYADLLRGLDFACSLPFVDSTRTAAAGASFGGYMMNWFLGHAGDRFKTIVTHAGVYNFDSMYGTTDEVWFDEYDHGGTPWDSPEHYRRFSPHTYAKNFHTPTLITHGEQDFRVPISEAMQLFTALQRQGVPSKFVWFPDEAHGVLKPANSRFWLQTLFEWLARYLKADDGLYERSSGEPRKAK